MDKKKQCVSIENNLKNDNTKMAYQTVKELTNTKQRRVSVIQDKAGKCLTEEHEVLTRFTEFCSDLYNHESNGDTTILNGPYDTNDDKSPILKLGFHRYGCGMRMRHAASGKKWL